MKSNEILYPMQRVGTESEIKWNTCMSYKLSPEQLEIYRSFKDYKKAQEYMDNILKPKGVDNLVKPEAKITRGQLLTECQEHGTSKEALTVIADKYGLSLATIKVYMSQWMIRDDLKEENHTDSQQAAEPEKEGTIESTGLKDLYKVLDGEQYRYFIHRDWIRVVDKEQGQSGKHKYLTIPKDKLDSIALELSVLAKTEGIS